MKKLPFHASSILPKNGTKVIFEKVGDGIFHGVFINNKFSRAGSSYPAREVHFWQYEKKYLA